MRESISRTSIKPSSFAATHDAMYMPILVGDVRILAPTGGSSCTLSGGRPVSDTFLVKKLQPSRATSRR